ncbi:MAG: Ig-like domain-containing protein [Planctomycetota bacterium]|nr:Ig-like domain-containing protein [Planctomycetota bacterium]
MAGQNLDFTVNFSENVFVSGGTPTLALVLDSGNVAATYISGSGSSALIFRYTVVSGDLDPTGISVGNLALNGATLRDIATNNANTALNNVGDTSQVRVDTMPPVLVSSTPAAGAQNVQFSAPLILKFNEPVFAGNGDIIIRQASTGAVWETISVLAPQVSGQGSAQITLARAVSLAPQTAYFVEITAGAFTDNVGNAFAGLNDPAVLWFQTASLPPPPSSGSGAGHFLNPVLAPAPSSPTYGIAAQTVAAYEPGSPGIADILSALRQPDLAMSLAESFQIRSVAHEMSPLAKHTSASLYGETLRAVQAAGFRATQIYYDTKAAADFGLESIDSAGNLERFCEKILWPYEKLLSWLKPSQSRR